MREIGYSVAPMGFNPFRPGSRGPADIAMVVGAIIVTAAVVVWAILG